MSYEFQGNELVPCLAFQDDASFDAECQRYTLCEEWGDGPIVSIYRRKDQEPEGFEYMVEVDEGDHVRTIFVTSWSALIKLKVTLLQPLVQFATMRALLWSHERLFQAVHGHKHGAQNFCKKCDPEAYARDLEMRKELAAAKAAAPPKPPACDKPVNGSKCLGPTGHVGDCFGY